MRKIIQLTGKRREELIDITGQIAAVVRQSSIRNGLAALYAQGATAALMIQENWGASVRTDALNLPRQLIPRGVWLHDRQDGNGDAHLKAGLVGPSEVISLIDGTLGLSLRRNIFFREFDLRPAP